MSALSVLVVEDSRTQVIRLRADLEAHGFTVTVATDGAEALAAARRERPDIILSDVLMPGMDGFRFCREVQIDPSLRGIPVVLRTGAFVSDEDRAFAFKVGARGYIDKEVERAELTDLLVQLAQEDEQAPGEGAIKPYEFHGEYGDRLLTRLVDEASRLEKANEELRESRAQLQAIFDHSPIFIYVKDLEGRYLVANRHFESLGLDPDSLVGLRDLEIFDPQTAETFMGADRLVAERRAPVEVEEIFATGDGVRSFLSTKFPLFDADGEVIAISGVSIDITERSRLERRLRQAERLEAIGRLASGVAHDFNNLLTIISNYASFVREDLPPSDPRSDDLDQVQDAARRGANLVRQLMAFGGREDDSGAEELDLNSAIRAMDSLLRVYAGSHVELIFSLGTGVPPVKVDPTKVDQMVLNLVANARDAMPRGGKLEIETAPVRLEAPVVTGDQDLDKGLYATLTMTDTGTGMTEETLRNIFEPFFTTKEEGKGTGLGLATIHGIVRSVGGSITVRSEPGKGSAFTVWLPEAIGSEGAGGKDRPHLASRDVSRTAGVVADDTAGSAAAGVDER